MVTEPDLVGIISKILFIKVDLPAPLGPITPVQEPSGMCSEIFSKARLPLYSTDKFEIFNIISLVFKVHSELLLAPKI